MQTRSGWHEIFKVMRSKKLQPKILYPARLSFRFGRETKSLTDMQKAKSIQHYQTSFVTNAKGTALSRKLNTATRNVKIMNGKTHW